MGRKRIYTDEERVERERTRGREKYHRLNYGETRKVDPVLKKDTHLKSLYGITIEDYQVMMVKQGGVCKICNKPETAMLKGRVKLLAVDHCHVTGKIRGLLCADCNRALGMFKDNPAVLRNAAKYLEEV